MTVHPRATHAISAPSDAEKQPTVVSMPQAKPKILRRPAQFSTPAVPIPSPETPDLRLEASHAQPQPAASSPPRVWQDDARFSIALLAIVIGVNVALSLWLSPSTPIPSIADTARASAKPADVSSAPTPADALLFHLGEAGARVSEQ